MIGKTLYNGLQYLPIALFIVCLILFIICPMIPCIVVEEPNGVQYINIGRLVVSFTRKFVLTDSREALEYFYRLR